MDYPDYRDILVEREGRVLRILHNRPARRNAEDANLLAELDDALDRAGRDEEARCLVIGGTGEHFSAGHDLHDGMANRAHFTSAETWAWELEHFYGNAMRIRDHAKPTVAEVRGACIAGGFMVANSCDLLVAAEDAFFSDPVLHSLGVCAVEVLLHPWVLGMRRAKEFLYTGQRITAADALAFGLANRVVPVDRLREETMKLAQQVAAAPPAAMRLMKRSLNRTADIMGYRTSLEAHFDTHVLAQHGPECQAIIQAGMERSIAASKAAAKER